MDIYKIYIKYQHNELSVRPVLKKAQSVQILTSNVCPGNFFKELSETTNNACIFDNQLKKVEKIH